MAHSFMSHPTHDKKPFLVADWQHIIMLNYEVPPDILQPGVPPGFALEAWQGKHFVSVVGLFFTTPRITGLPFTLPPFAQVNLRFYVQGIPPNNKLRGVVFIKEIAPLYRIISQSHE